jgi:hypothetical protein
MQLRRSREELLADVRRRGGRIRRRRRTATALTGALALVLPVTALLAMGSRPDPDVHVTAAGPAGVNVAAPADPVVDATTTTLISAAAETVVPPTTQDPQDRGPGGPGRLPPAEPTTTVPTTRPAVDDPVIRSPTTIPPTTAAGHPPVATTAIAAGTPSGNPAVPACPVADVRVTVTVEKATYAPGETVRWTSTLENRSATTCAVSGRAFFHVEDNGGRAVGAFPHTADFQLPVKAEPGKTITNGLSWDQRDCSGSACVQGPAGTYVVVAEWTEAGPYVGRGSFSIGG